MAACQYFANQPRDVGAPFDFYRFAAGGDRIPVSPVLDNATGLCLYESATCLPQDVPSGEHCCKLSEDTKFPRMTWLFFPIVGGAMGMYLPIRCYHCKQRFRKRGNATWAGQMWEVERRRRTAANENTSETLECLGSLFFMVALAASIQVNTRTNKVSQERLSVPSRNGMIIADGILNPMDDIFSFIDDIMLVKIGIALGAGDPNMLRKVFKIGVFGGALCGCLGALVATVIVLVKPLKQTLLNPFAGIGNCPFVTSDVSDLAAYFMLSAWQWPFTFAANAFMGVAIALQDFIAFGFVGMIRSGILLTLIITVFSDNPNLELLGWCRLGTAVAACLLWCVNIAFRPSLQRRLGFRGASTNGPVGTPPVAAPTYSFWGDPDVRGAIVDGLSAMVCELSVELARTITLFVTAAAMGVSAFYQVSAHFTLQVTSGLAFAEGVCINMKLNGSAFLAEGLPFHFLWLLEYLSAFIVFTGIAAFVTTYTSILHNTFLFGENACVFASDRACLSEYAGFFGGSFEDVGSTMMQTMRSVAPVLTVRIAYRVARASLYSLQDFAFMVKVSIFCFVIFFLPAVISMGFVSKHASTAVLVMAIPNVTVFLCFAYRLLGHIRRLWNGTNEVFSRKEAAVMRRGNTGEVKTAATELGRSAD